MNAGIPGYAAGTDSQSHPVLYTYCPTHVRKAKDPEGVVGAGVIFVCSEGERFLVANRMVSAEQMKTAVEKLRHKRH